MPYAFNEKTGEVQTLDLEGQWTPAKRARNEQTGEELFLDGQEWKPLPAPKRKEPGFMASFGNLQSSMINGMTGGFLDEFVTAPVNTAVDSVLSMMGVPLKPGMGEGYEANLTALDKQRSQAREDMPWSSYGGEIGGAIVSPITRLLMNKGPVKPTIMGRVGTGIEEGARIGAVYGAGNATGSLSDRVEGAGVGMATGAGVGGIAPPLIEGAGKLVNKGLEVVVNRVRSAAFADRKVAAAVRDLGGGDLQKGTQEAARLLDEAGPDAALVDVLGMSGQRLGRAAANAPGPGSQIADDFVASRAAGRGERLQATADELAPQGFHADLDALSAQQRTQAAPLYQSLFKPVSDKAGKVYAQWDDRLQQFLDDPMVKQGMAKGIRTQQLEALAENKPFNFQEYAVKGFDDKGELIISGTPNLRAMDAAKRGMDEILDGYRDTTTGKLVLDERGRAIDKVRAALVKKLDDMTVDPATGKSAYAEARAAWAGPAKVKDAMWMGRRFLRGDEEMTHATYKAMTPSEQEAFKMGVRREIGGMINKDTQAAVGKFADKKADLWGRLKGVFDSFEFAKFKSGIESERAKFATDQFISPRANSKTAGTMEDIAAMGRSENPLLEAGFDAATGNWGGMLRGGKQWASDKWNSVDPKTAEGLAKALLNMTPQQQQIYLMNLIDKVKVPQIPRSVMRGGSRAATIYGATEAGR